MKEIQDLLKDSWTVQIDPTSNYECEFGSSQPIRFANPSLYNSVGEEIEIPKCHICDAYMSMAMGKESFQWLCHQGCQ